MDGNKTEPSGTGQVSHWPVQAQAGLQAFLVLQHGGQDGTVHPRGTAQYVFVSTTRKHQNIVFLASSPSHLMSADRRPRH